MWVHGCSHENGCYRGPLPRLPESLWLHFQLLTRRRPCTGTLLNLTIMSEALILTLALCSSASGARFQREKNPRVLLVTPTRCVARETAAGHCTFPTATRDNPHSVNHIQHVRPVSRTLKSQAPGERTKIFL